MVTTQTVINSDSRQSMRTQHTHTAMHLKHTAWTLIILLLAFTAPHSVVGDGSDVNSNRALQQACGGLGQKCCLRCPEGTSSDDCTTLGCTSGRICYQFGNREAPMSDGSDNFPNICLDSPPNCGQLNQACCYNNDATDESNRCQPGLTCIVQNVGYGDLAMYNKLSSDPSSVRSTAVMGTCRKLTTADCGKRWAPCGAAARRIGCAEKDLLCSPQDFCASPGDTLLAAPRCLPLPPRCGSRNNGCCPANKDGTTHERWLMDGQTPVPFCKDGLSFCLWKYTDYKTQGLDALNQAGQASLSWDGYFQRGYGTSRCGPLPQACGNPGEPCCPSMIDQRISGMIHNRRFKYQPCNYAAAGKVGIYCKGAWQSPLLAAGVHLGTCTLNTADCGTLGKQCCREDIPEVGPVPVCEAKKAPGTNYCDKDNVCSACPKVPVTPEQKKDCTGGVAQERG